MKLMYLIGYKYKETENDTEYKDVSVFIARDKEIDFNKEGRKIALRLQRENIIKNVELERYMRLDSCSNMSIIEL
jgi:hypothetical protein